MELLKKVFVYVMTALTVLTVFFLADVVLGAIIYLLCFAIWNIVVATKVLKVVMAFIIVLQIVLVFLCTVKYIKESEGK